MNDDIWTLLIWRRPQSHFRVRHTLRTIYGLTPFQRVQICEDWSLGIGDMSGQGDCLKVENIHLYA
jgi:hypothetical protein